MIFAVVTSSDITFFSVVILAVFVLLMISFIIGWWLSSQKGSVSPYSGLPLRRGSDLSHSSKEKALRFLYKMNQYENRMFDFNKAAMCRETGRLFPDSITWYGVIKVDWNFLKKRYPGNFVSWGSLTKEQQIDFRAAHESLDGFQTAFSSPNSSPRQIEREYAFEKPGPLYVDITTKVLLGWKCVPDSSLEVLIVQKPRKLFRLSTISTEE